MKAADIMNPKVVMIDSLATIAQAAKVMKLHNIKTLIVDRVSEKDAYGIITTTDIAQAIANAKNPATTYVCEVMTKPCHIAPVIKDKLLGVVSLTDIITKTDCLNPNNVKFISQTTSELGEFPFDELTADSWEIEKWEQEYDNWCSG